LGDFTTTWRVAPISLLAIAIGVLCAGVALGLLKLIALFTNLFFFGRWSPALVSPAGNHLGLFEILVPVGGALIIGLMARYGSERIRGHGIPEAIESILINGSRVAPRLALLKPISSAISIASGGPFGAEGPIIMTGGALGSLVAQFFHLTSVIDCAELRKLAGMVSLEDLLQARVHHLEEEKRRERPLRIRLPFLTAKPAQGVPVGETEETS
jgi:chloride channel protein, CIC family